MSDRKLITAIGEQHRRTWYNKATINIEDYYPGGMYGTGSYYGDFELNIKAKKLDDDTYEIDFNGAFTCKFHKNKGMLDECITEKKEINFI